MQAMPWLPRPNRMPDSRLRPTGTVRCLGRGRFHKVDQQTTLNINSRPALFFEGAIRRKAFDTPHLAYLMAYQSTAAK
jgi:hypothetical protein